MGRRYKRKWRAENILGRRGQEIGEAGEVRVLKACERSFMPSWWLGIRHGTFIEDTREATDYIISTDVGEIRIDIKTSLHKGPHQFPERNREGIAIVFVNLNESDAEVRKRVIDVVARERRSRMGKKK
ncbi:MAG: hypothetical protein Q8R36_00065 [bacterium]|nr:hypothetical protein [bacterium]